MSEFAAERPRLTAIATRLLGSEADADDVLQEAWLRLSEVGDVEELPAWLTTVVTRLCLDQLRRRRTRSVAEAQAAEAQVGGLAAPAGADSDVLLADRVGDAMAVVLDTLTPGERAAFVLHDVFGYSFDEITSVLGRSATAVRQLASRARRKVRGVPEPAQAQTQRVETQRIVDAFLTAARGGDLSTLLSLLAPDAVMRADPAGQALGTDAVYEGAAAVAARFNGTRGATPVVIDGERGAAWLHRGKVKVAFVFHAEAGVVREIELIADPDVLATMEVARVRTTRSDAERPHRQ